jgi:hypothetical protein
MNPGEINSADTERQALLGQLNAAEAVLRGNLHVHRVDATARAHMQRALAHLLEAYIAINEAGRARTVEQLVNDLMKVERLTNQLQQQSPPGIAAKPIRV